MRKVFLVLIIISSIVTMSCQDNISDRSFVSAIGVDLTEDDNIVITLQIVKPFTPSLQGRNLESKNSVWIHSTSGKTILEPIRKQLETVNRLPYYSHVQVIVIGEDLARKRGIDNLLDIFERDHELRLIADVIVTKDLTAKEVLEAKSELEPIPAKHIVSILNDTKANPLIHKVTFKKLVEMLDYPSRNATLGVIMFDEEQERELSMDNMKIEDIAVFQKDKLVAYLNNDETYGLKYIKNEVNSTIIEIQNPYDEERVITIEQIRSKTKRIPIVDGKDIRVKIEIVAEGKIGSIDGNNEDFMSKESIHKLEKAVQKEISKNIYKSVNRAQKDLKLDIFEFGELFHKNYNEYWKSVEKDWETIFPDVEVVTDVDFKIRRSGLISNPLKIR